MTDSLEAMKECQVSKSINSCFKCSQMLVCDIRSKYVKDVYLSMGMTDDVKQGFNF